MSHIITVSLDYRLVKRKITCDATDLICLLTFLALQLGFFKRVRPPQEDCTEKEQLQPEENGNTDA